jgi:hypothetical protein
VRFCSMRKARASTVSDSVRGTHPHDWGDTREAIHLGCSEVDPIIGTDQGQD